MFDLSYSPTLNKRRPGKRGAKQRYAVYRAEHNIAENEKLETLCKKVCEKRGLNLDDFIIEHKQKWIMTWEFITITLGMFPYGDKCQAYLKRIRTPEDMQVMKNNVALAEKIRNERLPRG